MGIQSVYLPHESLVHIPTSRILVNNGGRGGSSNCPSGDYSRSASEAISSRALSLERYLVRLGAPTVQEVTVTFAERARGLRY